MIGYDCITPADVTNFLAVTSRTHGETIRLASCKIDGQPGVAIVRLNRVSEHHAVLVALYVAITSAMEIDIGGIRRASRGDDDGRPKTPEQDEHGMPPPNPAPR